MSKSGKIDYQELDHYLKVVLGLLEGFADVKEAEASLKTYLEIKADRLPPELREMMLELLEEKRKKDPR
jgi:hypothetical protein